MKSRLLLSTLLVALTSAVFFSSCSNEEKPDTSVLGEMPYKVYTDSIKQFPDNFKYYLNRALLLSQSKMHALATADYKKAWELSQTDAVGIEYASNLILNNKLSEALELLKNCQAKFPENEEFTRRISELYAIMGKRKEALEQYDLIISKDSSNFMAYYEKGIILMRLKDTAAAIAALEQSYFLQPLAITGQALANIYSNQGNPRTLVICDDIIAHDSSSILVDAHFLKGTYLSDHKQCDAALKEFETCIKLDWTFIDAHLEKGLCYFDQKKYEQSLDAFRVAATVSNTNPDAYFWMGRVYEAQNQKEEAQLNYQRAIALDEDFNEAKERLKNLK
ncbi:MAG: tetratricopeptide repeat protein [Chitinophagaceae bacterium]|nr:tetratricopeptide repeat protein [Chitinophagaceae bacterium]